MSQASCPVTYCTNIHPGESWAETVASVAEHVLPVKRAVCPGEPFPVGLRISGRASLGLDLESARRFRGLIQAEGLEVRTVNGFPYGRFHGVPVKAEVYRPDWRHPERLAYTRRLIGLLALWLPPGATGSISTVPLGWRGDFGWDEAGPALRNLRLALERLDRLAQSGGPLIRLAVEPEPGCLLETTADVVGFFGRCAEDRELSPYLPYLAVCYDCCHQALQFEDPANSLRELAQAGIAIGHVQVSSALSLDGPDPACLSRFVEPVYLHQAVARLAEGGLARYLDLPQALSGPHPQARAWRVHFHLPVFLDDLPECRTTQPFLREILPLLPPGVPLEVETYTWSVLPPDLRMASLTDSIVREIGWVEGHRAATSDTTKDCDMNPNENIIPPQTVAASDGRDGKPAYILHDGRVYDVSASTLWDDGSHMGSHRAGGDLTGELAGAPHGDEVLTRFPQVGVVASETTVRTAAATAGPMAEAGPEQVTAAAAGTQSAQAPGQTEPPAHGTPDPGPEPATEPGAAPHVQAAPRDQPEPAGGGTAEALDETASKGELPELVQRYPILRRHPHPMTVHFPIAFAFAVVGFTLLFLAIGWPGFDVAALNCLGAGFLMTPVTMVTGYFSWRFNYRQHWINPVTIKLGLSILLLSDFASLFAWRVAKPDILAAPGPGRDGYVALVLALIVLVSIIGWFGATLTFPLHRKTPAQPGRLNQSENEASRASG